MAISRLFACALTVSAVATASRGQYIVARHFGAADPQTEGWSTGTPNPPAGVTVGPVTTPGVTAWYVEDQLTVAPGGYVYSGPPSLTQLNKAMEHGWTLRVCMNIDAPNPDEYTIWLGLNTVEHATVRRRFDMWFRDEGNDEYVLLMTANPPGCGPTGIRVLVPQTGQCHAPGFHLFELKYDPGTEAADLYIDGILRFSDYAGHGLGLGQFARVGWGAGATCGRGRGEFHLIEFEVHVCYADCDQSTGVGVLDLFDFLCFQNLFVNADPYACDCDVNTGPGICDVFDFLCFQNAFVSGCP